MRAGQFKVDDLDELLTKQFLVHRLFPIGQPNANRPTWLVRWQSWRAGQKFHARFVTEAEAIRFRDHLASEMERTATQRRAAERGQAPTKPTTQRRSGGGGPVLINRSEPVPGTGLTVKITTAWRDHRTVYTVAAVTDDGAPTDLPKTYDDPAQARRAANKLYARLTKENDR